MHSLNLRVRLEVLSVETIANKLHRQLIENVVKQNSRPTQCWPINGCSNALRTTIAFYALAVSSDFVPSERSVGMGGVLAFKCNKELEN